MDAWATAEAIASGRLSAAAAVTEALAAIRSRDGPINAFTVVRDDAALAAAAEVDRGERTGPLAGVPISVKDHVWLAGWPSTSGSRALAEFVPDQDCECVARLVAAGAVVVGKTNNPEFCYRGTTFNEIYGITRNPRDTSRTTGGSSGGAAASVAAGMVPLAIGTDGGGSIRIPSAFCGAYGIKPTFGLVPKLPGFRGWPTLSVTGPIAGSVRDLALALSVMAGPSASDPLTYPAPGSAYLAAADDSGLVGLRFAASEDLGFAGVDPDVRQSFRAAVAVLRGAGAIITDTHPAPVDPGPLWDSIALPEGFASEGPLLERSPDLVGPDATAIIRAGATATARDYLDAQDARGQFAETWARFFASYDVLLTPTMPVVAFSADRMAPETLDGQPVPETFDAWCALALPANLAGLPAISIPIGSGRDGLPVGLQLIGPRWSDPALLVAAGAIDAVLTVGQ
ncbi:MAG: amidase family protein [Actinomycetota bacterium]|nr:amidase family protein [Actinomycetota bacterium]